MAAKTQQTVLIGFAEALAAPEVVWSLVDAGVRVHAFARSGSAVAIRHSRHVVCHEVPAPEVDINGSLSGLESLLAELGRDAGEAAPILFPIDDKSVLLGSRARLPGRWLLAGPAGTNADLALNKCLQVQLAREAGFSVPETALARTAAEVRSFTARQPFPIILKAAQCVPVSDGRVRSCKKWICASEAELDTAIAQWEEKTPLLAQPFFTGVGEGVFGLAAPEGVRAWSGHRRLRMMNPQGSGSSACISLEVPSDLKAKTREFIERARWRGLFMIELLRDTAGTPWFVELNGRPWGSMSLARRQGLEYPAWHVALAADPASQAGMKAQVAADLVCRHMGREFLHLLFVLRGPRSKAQGTWPSFWQAARDVFTVRSSDTVYNWRSEDPEVFFADFCATMRDNLFKSKA